MILDDIEFDSLSRADILLLAHLRPRLWSFTLSADALADADLRDTLTREIARRAAQLANERARLAFEQSENLPFPDHARQTRLDELADQIALESLRALSKTCQFTAATAPWLHLPHGQKSRLVWRANSPMNRTISMKLAYSSENIWRAKAPVGA